MGCCVSFETRMGLVNGIMKLNQVYSLKSLSKEKKKEVIVGLVGLVAENITKEYFKIWKRCVFEGNLWLSLHKQFLQANEDSIVKKANTHIYKIVISALQQSCKKTRMSLTKHNIINQRNSSSYFLYGKQSIISNTSFSKENYSILNSSVLTTKLSLLKKKPLVESFHTLTDNLNFFGEAQIYELNSKYKIDRSEKIGKGSFSSVYRGFDMLGNVFAIKHTIKHRKYSPSIINNKNDVLENELKILKILKHKSCPHVIDVYEVIEDKENTFIVMEYIESSLYTNINKKDGIGLSEKKMWIIVRAMLMAIDFLHNEMNIVHSDIHPKNILISSDGLEKIKLCDFGLSKHFNECKINSTSTDKRISYIKRRDLFNGYLPPPEVKSNHLNYTQMSCNQSISDANSLDYGSNELFSFESRKAFDMWMLGITIYWTMMGNIDAFQNSQTNVYRYEINIIILATMKSLIFI